MQQPEGWSLDEGRMKKCFVFADFSQAMAFMVEVGFHCERVNHHPDWKNVYDKVWVELATHDAGAVTAKDFALAAHMDAVFRARAGRE